MDALPRRPYLSIKVLSISARALLWLVLLAWFLFSAAWAALHFFIVPRIGELRPELETRASQALGVPVRIGAIAAHTDTLFPSFRLQDVRLLDREGRVALQLPLVQATLSPRSLWNLGFEQLAIDQPELEIRRAHDGRVYVAGIEITRHEDDSGRATDWIFSQTEWVIRNGRVLWLDEMSGAPAVQLQQLDLRMHNGARLHELRLDATPPAELGSRFSLRGRFRQPLLSTDAGIWQQWQGQLYGVMERVDVTQLRRHLPIQLAVSGGRGAIRAWLDVDRGKLSGAVVDLSLVQLAVQLRQDLPALDLSRLSGRFSGRLVEGGLEFGTQGLKFDTVDGLHWRGGDVRVSHQAAAGSVAARGEVRATGIHLEALAQLARRLPLESRIHDALARLAPKGRVEILHARWSGPWEAPQRYDARGSLRDIQIDSGAQALLTTAVPGMAPAAMAPGVAGLNVDFDLTQDGGRASAVMQKGYLSLPGVLDQERIDVESLAAEVNWRQNGARFSVQIPSARFANADAQGELQLKWSNHESSAVGERAGLPGNLDLQGTLSRAELAAVHRYLPRALPREVRDYLRQALVQGRAGGVRFRVKGDLHDFPYDQQGQGEFRVTASLQDARFAYVPEGLQPAGQVPWPALVDLSGDLMIDHASLDLRNVTAKLASASKVRISQGAARIPEMGRQAQVMVDMQLAGPLEDAVRGLVSDTPVNAVLNGGLADVRAAGNSEIQLKLQLPLNQLEQTRVQGQIRLANNEILFGPQLPRLTRVRGLVFFSESGFALSGVQARALGGDLRADGGSIAMPDVAVTQVQPLRVKGTVTAAGLRQESQLGAVARLAQHMNGSTSYAVEMDFQRGLPEFNIFTTLQGMALDLPQPLWKSAETVLPLRVRAAAWGGERDALSPKPAQDMLRVDLGQLVSIRYVRDITSHPAKVLRGSIGMGLPAGEVLALPDAGVDASVAFEDLDLDAWREVLAGAEHPGSAQMPSAVRDYLPTRLTMKGAALVLAGQKFNGLTVDASRDDQTWRANLDAREVAGYVEYRQDAGAGTIYGRLTRLILAQEGAKGVETVLDEQPISIPAVDVVIDDFELRGKNLGRLEIEAINRGLARRDAGAREWRLSKLRLTMPEAIFSATGNWAVYQELSEPTGRTSVGRMPVKPERAERRRTVMNFRLDVTDAGGLLSRLGTPGVVRAGKGFMEGQATWIGSPLALNYPTMGGKFNVNIESGQFLKADPGLAKLLGVLSLQSLPRRLTLDFRDVFSEGFAFDFLRGDVQVDQGVAMTTNLQMKGVNAAVLMEGHADLARETQELRVVVVPEINAGTASLIAGWLNPAVGLGTFLAQLVLRGPMIAATTQELRVSGSWSDPQVVKIEKRAEDASNTSGTTQ